MVNDLLREAPPWLAAQEEAVAWRQIRIAHERNDLQQMLVLVKNRLDLDRLQAARVLALAKECQANGETAIALALVHEIVRKVPEYHDASGYLAVLEGAPAAAPAAEAPVPTAVAAPGAAMGNAKVFLARLDRAIAGQHWDEAAQMVRALRHAPPEWVEGEEDGLAWREVGIAQAQNDPPQVLKLVRLRLEADRRQAVRVLALARTYETNGEPAMAFALAREITQKVPEYRDGVKFFNELQSAQDQTARPAPINPIEAKEGGDNGEPAP
jgi:hypothetical protein